ncbi:Neuronal acetylcholine receptor subunit alpha-2 [Echinococcus granulosus]|uniref:Neuronal acetylcholine receptor subunit alpha-2 n=1 Tax=Echinococcus granulosus TaxID=6210 RepID=W6UPQ8_ECHGR|nr:Neuronal acetylcholine receptor subunit alpha-2 [Echinococcus granulosus]EUB63615.1 Neuronal acetylcholine receptor subunit alpha-2 [Echinococcus granulosus]
MEVKGQHLDPAKITIGENFVDRLPDIPGGWKEKELVRDLLHDYEKKARPVVDGVSPIAQLSETLSVQQITIEFGLSLIQILELDENEQVLTTSIRTLYRWKDYHMVWDPAEYDNITSVQIPTSKLWLPDIALYNYADERLEERRRSDLLVSYTGTVEWQPLAIYKSACFVHIKYFPFDQQNCKFKFGPWTYDAARTNITFYNNSDGWFLNDYEESPEWELLATKAVFTGFKYQCCAEIYPDITFQLVIKRQPAFYNYVIILPCFLLSSLTLVLFCLPAETPAKMQLGMTMFQAFNFLLLILTQSIPSGASSFPLIELLKIAKASQIYSETAPVTVFIEYGARLFFINSPSSRAAKANSASAKTNCIGAGGVGGNSGGGSGWSRRAADSALAEAAHADKVMRSAAGATYRSTFQTLPAQMGRCHTRNSFRGISLLYVPTFSDLVTSMDEYSSRG